jgi:hypothetical protein
MEMLMTMSDLWMMYHGVVASKDEGGFPRLQCINEPEEVEGMFIPPSLNSDNDAYRIENVLSHLSQDESTIGSGWDGDYVAADGMYFFPKAKWTNPWRLPYVIADILKGSEQDSKFFKERLRGSIYILPNVLMVGLKDHFDVFFTSDKGSMKVGEVRFTLTSWSGYVDLAETVENINTRYDNELPGIRIENGEVYLTIDQFGNEVNTLIHVG